MITRQVAYRKFSTAVETQVFIAAKEEFVFERGIETFTVYFAITSHNARQFENRLLSVAIESAADFHDRFSECPDNLIFDEKCCSLFPG